MNLSNIHFSIYKNYHNFHPFSGVYTFEGGSLPPGFNVVLGDIHLLSLTGGNDYYKSVKINWPGYPR